MAKVKVLHIHTLPVISGSGINTLLTMAGLDKERYEVEFACAPGGDLIEEARKQGIKFRPVRNFVQRISIYNDLFALIELICLMRRQKYNLVHTHNSKAGFIGRLAAKLAGVPLIVHTIHGFAFHEYENPPRRKLFICLERLAGRFTDKLITISEPLRKWGCELNIGKPDKYITIYSGIEWDRFQVNIDIEKKKRQLGIKPQDKVIGTTSKLWEGKGHKCILQAARSVIVRVPDVKFIFVGEGYLRKELEELKHQLDLGDYVIFAGFRTDIPEVTAVFDIAVLASFFEGMGRVLLEAMVLGKPVIGTRVGGIVDVVDDGKTGILIPPGDPSVLAEAIVRLLKDDDLRRAMGEAGRQKVDARFTAETMVRKIEQVYDELLKNRELI